MSKPDSSMLAPAPLEEAALKLNLLSMVDIFQDLSEDEIKEINAMVNMVTVKKGRVFYRPEEEAEVLFLLKKGKVQVYTITADGKRLVIENIGPGTFFGEMPLTAQSIHQAYAEAAEESLVCVLSKGDLERLLTQRPLVAIRLLEVLSQRLAETRTKLEETTFRNATERVCRALLRLAGENRELSGLTHQELADSTGLYRETVTNVLNRLQAQGLVELGKRKIIILDRAGLEKTGQA